MTLSPEQQRPLGGTEGGLRVVVASQNPVKLRAARRGFERVFEGRQIDVEGVTVSSGVPDQPMSDAETLGGAENRVAAAARQCPNADFWVGLEGGIEEIADELAAFGWMVVRSADGRVGRSRTASFVLPRQVTEKVRRGVELGVACDEVFDRVDVKRSEGAVGLLTGGAVDRTALYEPSVVLALVPFVREELY